MAPAVQVLCDAVADLGEGPLWSGDENALYWLDMTNRVIWRHEVGRNETRSYKVTGIPTAMALRARGGLILALRNGFAFLNTATGEERRFEVDVDFSRERFNDAKCDRRGRFFVGSMDKSWKEPIGGLWRLDPDLSLHRVDDGILVGNGMAFSPDDTVLYFSDSRTGYVYAYDYDIETGLPANRRVHLDFRGRTAHPDGCTVDDEGCLWIAELGTGAVGRYAPDGTRIGEIHVPTTRVTSVAFGGTDLRTLYVTSMQYGLSEAQLAAETDAGRTFHTRPGATGLAEPKFAG